MALQITITNAGRAALVNAQNSGTTSITISRVAFGTGRYTPTAAQTKLTAEVKRISSIFGDVVAADTIHLIAQDESADAYNVGEIGLYTNTGVLFGVYSVPGSSWIIEKASASTLLLAVDVILTTLSTANLTFGDASFINPPATVDVPGVVELATSAETATGTDATRAVTPKGLADLTASTVRAGIVRLSSAINNTSTGLAATASAVKQAYDTAAARLAKSANLSDLSDPAVARVNLGLTGAISLVLALNLAAGRALVSDANGKIAVSAVTAKELGTLDGVTSNIQTQLNAKAAVSTSVVAGDGLSGGGTLAASRTLAVNNTVVRTSGNQTISGKKTMADIVSPAGNNYRMITALGSVFQRTTDNSWYLMLSDSADGSWNNLRPLTVILSTGRVSMGHGLTVSGGISGTLTGNASTATKLETARTLSLSGDLSGSASFDGSGNVTINAAVKDDSHNHTIANVDGLQTALDGKAGSSVSIRAGDGLSGGGTISTSRTMAVDSTVARRNSGNEFVSWVTVRGNFIVDGDANFRGTLSMNNGTIASVKDPSADQDAANKRYVDTKVGSLISSEPSSAPFYACRAWVNFSYSDSTVTYHGRGNVSSVKRNSVGNYTINFSGAMPSSGFAVALQSQGGYYDTYLREDSRTGSSVTILTTHGNTYFDPPRISVSVFH